MTCESAQAPAAGAASPPRRRAAGETVRETEVWRALDAVTDPELDEPLTEMGFIEAVEVDAAGGVTVRFRLPTYWCSPNFAFLMAEGIREAVAGLGWPASIAVRLEDHLCAAEMNAAVDAGRSFAEALAEFGQTEAGGGGAADLAEVREKFERKAFEKRQEAVLLGLRARGFTPADLAAMTLGQLDLAAFDAPEAAKQAPRYRSLLVSRGLARAPGDHAFPDPDGAPLTVEGYAARMSALRAVRINMEFGGALCRGLRENRYREAAAPAKGCGGEPTLADFIEGRVPLPVGAR
ncbi:iron-sulfur cluster assembly protein [Rubrimonas cliftonensis]|uniref:Metal-sulfur cluster biosynthetic enzyme n=1 Tax=Rubrimonas cliftonensis TaxID=89524 RepID=A0A1H4BT41_9RHOB|nr:iron-sulfur cluster assembly protein [Rubrimonas cliftonensis]SEA51264.1 Metal-sulfur cluster biosynthetic enzyme [Rubrimonas cliftonensis]